MMAISLALIIAVVGAFGYGLIKELLYTSLEQHVSSDSQEVNKQLNSTFYYLNGVADSLELAVFDSDPAITNFLAQTIERYDTMPTGVYLTLEDGAYLDPTGYDPGKDNRTTDWYALGMSHNDKYYYFYDVPYFDNATGALCATVVRHVQLTDGRGGVLAADIMLASCQEYLNNIQIYGSGKAIMIADDGMVLSSPNVEYCGANVADLGDDLYTAIGGVLNSEEGVVRTVRANGSLYFVVMETASGTNWKVINYAKSTDVLSSVITMIIIIVVAALLVLGSIAFLLATALKRMVKKPVEKLTENIRLISEGDFTVDIESNGNDEIAFMNDSMKQFVGGMRDTLKNIQVVSKRLENDSKASKDIAEILNSEAKEQSISMEQILDNMEAMSESVTEVAEDATSLAQTVSDLTEAEAEVEDNMRALVEKADTGESEMSRVSDGMETIVESMTEMNGAVNAVNDAAEKINQIIEMISGIANQTNLLSLNASIEAARAGEAGKGFAVVATEIGQLANNSSDATSQIAEIIQAMTSRVSDLSAKSEANTRMINESSESITSAAKTFKEITEDLSQASFTLSDMAGKMQTVSDVATNMASVSQEQSSVSMEITSTINGLTESSRNVARSSENVSNAANSVAEAVNLINDSVKSFTIDAAKAAEEIIDKKK
ncbi:MAG: HAMP domain-containing protein [Pseudobutyrivibrio sp.]|nr:HAMP domain-containing protein [Pseudobutyrivibrio sp.]